MKITPLLRRILLAAFGIVVMRGALRIWGGLPIETLNGGQPMTAQRGIVLLMVLSVVIFLVATLRFWKK